MWRVGKKNTEGMTYPTYIVLFVAVTAESPKKRPF